MKRFNHFQAIYQSFYSRALYRDVNRNWGADVILYLLLILALSWVVSTVNIQHIINRSYQAFSTDIIPQLPVIMIKNGKASTVDRRPYFIKYPNENENFIVVDTTGRYTSLESINTRILVTKTAVHFQDRATVEKIQRFPKTLTFDFVPTDLNQILMRYVPWMWIVIFPILLFFSFIYRLIQIVFYAAIGKLFAILSGVKLPYSSIFKLATIAITPALVISTVLTYLNVTFHYDWVLYFIISMIYLTIAIRATK